jgi:hypothetical protein
MQDKMVQLLFLHICCPKAITDDQPTWKANDSNK